MQCWGDWNPRWEQSTSSTAAAWTRRAFLPEPACCSIGSWIPPLFFSDTMESLPVHPQPGAAAVVESWASRPRSPTADRPSLQLRPPAVIHIDLPAPELNEAHLPGSPRSPRLVAAALSPPTAAQAALPSLPEKQLGVELHVDRTEAAGHPGVPCWELPPHAHRWAGTWGAGAGHGRLAADVAGWQEHRVPDQHSARSPSCRSCTTGCRSAIARASIQNVPLSDGRSSCLLRHQGSNTRALAALHLP